MPAYIETDDYFGSISVAGESAKETTPKGIQSRSRGVIVRGLSGSDRATEAYNIVAAKYREGSTVGSPTSGLVVRGISMGSMLSSSSALVVVTYGRQDLQKGGNSRDTRGNIFTTSKNSSLVSKQINTDKQGNLLTVSYIDNDGLVDINSPRPSTYTQGVILTGFFPQTVLRFTGTSTQGDANFQKLLGKVNSKPWRGGESRVWKCTSLSTTESTESPGEMQVTIEFTSDVDKWVQSAGFVNKQTGRIPEDANDGANKDNAVKRFSLEDEINFSEVIPG